MTVLAGANLYRDPGFPFHISRFEIPPDDHISSHTHDFVELVFIIGGSAVHETADHRHTLSPGDVFVIEPNVYHSYTGAGTEATIGYNVLFDRHFLRKELDPLLQLPAFVQLFYLLPFMRSNASFIPYQSLQEEEKRAVEHHLDTIHAEYMGMRDGWQLLVKTRWMECLVWLSRYLKEERTERPPAVGDTAWIESIRHFIELNFRQNLTLAQLSRVCGMSVSSFTAKFKEATGTTVMDYKHAIQVRHACGLLRESNRKILDIAYAAGFNDISFFNKIFRKHCGMTPRAYRALQRGR